MGLENLIKREISITIFTVLLVTTIFIGLSYAIFKVDVDGKTNAITFGDIQMSFCIDETCDEELQNNVDNIIGKTSEGDSTKYVPIYPHEDPKSTEDWSQLTPYTFKLKNTGTLDLYVKLFLEPDANGTKIAYQQANKETFTYEAQVSEDQIMVGLNAGGTTPTTALYSTTKDETTQKHIIAKNIVINAGEEKTFQLYLYLKSNAANAAQGKYFITQISAQGEFIPPENAPVTSSPTETEEPSI